MVVGFGMFVCVGFMVFEGGLRVFDLKLRGV